MKSSRYIIRGGLEGRERLRILSRVMRSSSLELLQAAGAKPGMACLDVGCGSGDLAFDLALLVSPGGKVVATDIDETKIELARAEAVERKIANVEFRLQDITQDEPRPEFDLVHARFLLSHLPRPVETLQKMRQMMRPGGAIVIEDVDFRGHFCHPDCEALWRFVDLYTQAVARCGGDANIGPRLPSLLQAAGFQGINTNVTQPAGSAGDVALITPITMENIADAVLAEGLATQAEIDQLVDELYDYANQPGIYWSLPRIVEAWGNR